MNRRHAVNRIQLLGALSSPSPVRKPEKKRRKIIKLNKINGGRGREMKRTGGGREMKRER
jgi:hypothetical protein